MAYIEEIKIRVAEIKEVETSELEPRHKRDENYQSYPKQNQNEDTKKRNYVEADNANEDSVCFMSDRDKSVQNIGNDIIVFFIDSGCII